MPKRRWLPLCSLGLRVLATSSKVGTFTESKAFELINIPVQYIN